MAMTDWLRTLIEISSRCQLQVTACWWRRNMPAVGARRERSSGGQANDPRLAHVRPSSAREHAGRNWRRGTSEQTARSPLSRDGGPCAFILRGKIRKYERSANSEERASGFLRQIIPSNFTTVFGRAVSICRSSSGYAGSDTSIVPPVRRVDAEGKPLNRSAEPERAKHDHVRRCGQGLASITLGPSQHGWLRNGKHRKQYLPWSPA